MTVRKLTYRPDLPDARDLHFEDMPMRLSTASVASGGHVIDAPGVDRAYHPAREA